MKKRSGFTLAEILVTLGVIGVIASITVPTLVQDVQDAQFKTSYKKIYSDLNQATTLTVREKGGTMLGIITADDDTMMNLYTPYLNMVKKCPKYSSAGICWHNTSNWKYLNNNPIGGSLDIRNTSAIILNNGAFIRFTTYSSCSSTHCGDIFIDVNGFKGPNIVGKDIFKTLVTHTMITPVGNGSDCSGDGTNCSSYNLIH